VKALLLIICNGNPSIIFVKEGSVIVAGAALLQNMTLYVFAINV
jgi:hypothetical protein